MQNESFQALELSNGLLFEAAGFEVYGFVGRQTFNLSDGTWLVYVHEGQIFSDNDFPIREGMYASLTGLKIHSTRRKTRAMLVRFKSYMGMEREEVVRLAMRKGISQTDLIKNSQWSKAWVPR